MSLTRYDVVFTGRVQGVFFRATTEKIARKFDVTGWVRNEPDGSVRLVVEGDADELDRFISAVQRTKCDNIDEVRIDRRPATGELSDFRIAR